MGRKLLRARHFQTSSLHGTAYNIQGSRPWPSQHPQNGLLFCTFHSVLSESEGAPPILRELRGQFWRSQRIASYRVQARQASLF